ncbi:hypothetical protein GCM10010331_46990 [Streptomyces xanthochromogenes]|nr:hypothetical protein GCM10010331_46990 [Streptomyces xanthochromogenes]
MRRHRDIGSFKHGHALPHHSWRCPHVSARQPNARSTAGHLPRPGAVGPDGVARAGGASRRMREPPEYAPRYRYSYPAAPEVIFETNYLTGEARWRIPCPVDKVAFRHE